MGQPLTSRSPILVVDDDLAVASVMVALLEQAGHDAVAAQTAAEALSLARRTPPVMAVLDIQLPDLSGYEILQMLRAEVGERLPVLFVSGVRVEPYDRAAGLLVGADDYLVKPFAADEFLARVRALLRRVDRSREFEPGLTARESEVLTLLAAGLEPLDVADRLEIGHRTVETHLEHIMEKLGAHSRAQVIALAYRQGLVSATSEPS